MNFIVINERTTDGRYISSLYNKRHIFSISVSFKKSLSILKDIINTLIQMHRDGEGLFSGTNVLMEYSYVIRACFECDSNQKPFISIIPYNTYTYQTND